MRLQDIPEFCRDTLIDDAERTPEELEAMSPFEVFDAYLQWEGIIGYSSQFWGLARELQKGAAE